MEKEAIVLDRPDQIEAYRMAVFKQGIKALLIGMKINSGYTSTVCRNYVSGLTGKKYPAGKKGLQLALDDLEFLIKVGAMPPAF
tara:strand:+ start:326 stop:577 length:252 start_codon:yes stop_codon:yes gene_type:complete